MRVHIIFEPCINIIGNQHTSLGIFEEWDKAVEVIENVLNERYPGSWQANIFTRNSSCQYSIRGSLPGDVAVLGVIEASETIQLLPDLWWVLRTWIKQRKNQKHGR